MQYRIAAVIRALALAEGQDRVAVSGTCKLYIWDSLVCLSADAMQLSTIVFKEDA